MGSKPAPSATSSPQVATKIYKMADSKDKNGLLRQENKNSMNLIPAN